MKTIAVIDDDVYIGNLIEDVLTNEGYNVIRAYSGTEALMLLENNRPNLVLLDLMLPGLTGEDLINKIKNIPVIVVSAKVDVDDKVNLLMNGAVDYITKPFNIKELIARVTVQLRNVSTIENENCICVNDLKLEINTHNAYIGNISLHLTRTEFAILKLFMLNPQQVFAKSVILDRISIDTPDCTENSLKVHMSNLRQKLRDAGGKEYIESVWGIGFKLAY